MSFLARHDWPGYAIMKDFAPDSKLNDREQRRYPSLTNDEWALNYLKASVKEQYEIICTCIERMRSSKNLSQAKIAAFTNRVRGGIAFLTNYGPILTQLSSDLLDETVQKRLHCLYSHNYLEFRGSLGDFQSHFETHISMKVSQSNSSVRFQFGHIAKLRNLIDSVVSRLSSIMGTLSIAFLMKLQPILDDREAFFRSQTANTADRDRAVAEIREEMDEIIGRQKELEKGATNLDRMFEVLVTFKNSLGLEEEDEGISLL